MNFKPRFALHGNMNLAKQWSVALLFSALIAFQPLAQAAPSCQQVFLPATAQATATDQAGALFLHERDSKLHTSTFVEKYVRKQNRQSGGSLQKPADKITAWLRSLEDLSQKAGQSDWALQNIKNIFYRQYVIKASDIPENYYQLQVRLARERGQGDITLSKEVREQQAQILITDQEASLDSWIEFMVSTDSREYPMWAKFWMFTGVTKLSKFNIQDGTFGNRTKETVAPFPELNHEAVSLVIDMILQRLDKKSLDEIKDPGMLKLVQGANFGKLYAHALITLGNSSGQFSTNEGRWVLYPQGSDPRILVDSLKGKSTDWCTKRLSTAQRQLKGGDFYVYYSLDNKREPTLPRIAIRMEGNDIGEVRGVATNQNMDEQIAQTKILSDKLKEFGEKGQAYEKKAHDMQLLTEIERKTKIGLPLSQSDLLFLYEFNGKIQGFGYETDPRIAEIKSQRDLISDFAILFSGPNAIKEFDGDLNLSWMTSTRGLILPQTLRGNLYLSGLRSAEGLQLPNVIHGNLYLGSLRSADGLRFPETIHGGLSLSGLASAEGAHLPKAITGNLDLSGLASAQGLRLPEAIGGSLNLGGLRSAEGLQLSTKLGEDLYLNNLISAEGLEFPKTIHGDLDLSGLRSAQGLIFPETINGSLNLSHLKTAEGLILPQAILNGLYLNSLRSTEDIVVPQNLDRHIYAPHFQGKFLYRP